MVSSGADLNGKGDAFWFQNPNNLSRNCRVDLNPRMARKVVFWSWDFELRGWIVERSWTNWRYPLGTCRSGDCAYRGWNVQRPWLKCTLPSMPSGTSNAKDWRILECWNVSREKFLCKPPLCSRVLYMLDFVFCWQHLGKIFFFCVWLYWSDDAFSCMYVMAPTTMVWGRALMCKTKVCVWFKE